jgi:hypothetical protein
LSEYSKLSLKREFMEKVEQFIEDYPEHGYRGLAQFVEDAVRRRADELRVFQLTPPLQPLQHVREPCNGDGQKIGMGRQRGKETTEPRVKRLNRV